MDRGGEGLRRADRLTWPETYASPTTRRFARRPTAIRARPARRSRPLSCDTHAHVIGPAARFPYARERIYTPPDSTCRPTTAASRGARRRARGAGAAERLRHRQYRDAGRDAAAGPGVRAVAVDSTRDRRRRARDASRCGRARPALQRRRPPRGQATWCRCRYAARASRSASRRSAGTSSCWCNVDEAPDFAEPLADIPVPIVLGHLGYPTQRRGAGRSAGLRRLLRLLDTGPCWIKLTGPYRISAAELPYEDVDAARTSWSTAPRSACCGVPIGRTS